jgi:hypothetical protein
MRKSFAFAAAIGLLAAGCGSSKHAAATRTTGAAQAETAARFVVGIQAELRRGAFATAWRTLHPAQKRLVSAQRLSACYPHNAFPRTVTFRATRVRDVTWRVPGTAHPSQAKEVRVTATSSGRRVDSFAQHVVRVGGAWTWMLSRRFFDAARRGAC